MTRDKIYLVKHSSSGYTLVETAAVLTIAAMMLVGGMALAKTWFAQADQSANRKRLSAIQQALANYETQFNRLPCPASFTVPAGNPNYGRESTSCPTGAPLAPGTFSAQGRNGSTNAYGNTPPVPNPPPVIIGALPVRDLGLPDVYRTDIYGGMYTYAITKSEATTLNGFAGAIDVVDELGNTVLPRAPFDGTIGTATYVVVAHGKDRKGAYTAAGAAPATACASVAGLDVLNCSYSGTNPVRFRSAPFSNRAGVNTWFDDMVVYGPSKTSPPTRTPSCTTVYSASATAGGSTGHHMYGEDAGGFIVFGTWVFAVFVFDNYFTPMDVVPPGVYNSTSPVATARCTSANYNVVAGGCTQTSGVPRNAGGAAVNATGSNGPVANVDGSGTYLGATAFPGGWGWEIGFGLVDGRNYQIVPPPLSHPAVPTAAGLQGWECHGSSANGERVQAYAVCCLSNGG